MNPMEGRPGAEVETLYEEERQPQQQARRSRVLWLVQPARGVGEDSQRPVRCEVVQGRVGTFLAPLELVDGRAQVAGVGVDLEEQLVERGVYG